MLQSFPVHDVASGGGGRLAMKLSSFVQPPRRNSSSTYLLDSKTPPPVEHAGSSNVPIMKPSGIVYEETGDMQNAKTKQSKIQLAIDLNLYEMSYDLDFLTFYLTISILAYLKLPL